MKFWDTSPVVPICINEPSSKAARSGQISSKIHCWSFGAQRERKVRQALCGSAAKVVYGTKTNEQARQEFLGTCRPAPRQDSK